MQQILFKKMAVILSSPQCVEYHVVYNIVSIYRLVLGFLGTHPFEYAYTGLLYFLAFLLRFSVDSYDLRSHVIFFVASHYDFSGTVEIIPQDKGNTHPF